jgi:hypothetical protein
MYAYCCKKETKPWLKKQWCIPTVSSEYVAKPTQSGQVRRYDFEYERKGSANLFVMRQPLAGWQTVKSTKRRTKVDFAHCMKELVDVHFPDAEVIGSCWTI